VIENTNQAIVKYIKQGSKMKLSVKKVANKDEAIVAIKAQESKIVELDYAVGGRDILELGRLGRKHIVAVQFIAQIAVIAKNEISLQDKLSSPKETFKQRFIHLDFDVDTVALNEYQSMASKFGDMIIPKGFEPLASEVWV
jgi:hypothetical protein